MVLRVGDRVMGGSRGEEVGRDELRALVHELVERVLTVRASGSPDDGLLNVALRYNVAHEGKERTYTGLVVDALAVLGDELAVRLHVTLSAFSSHCAHTYRCVLTCWK